MLLFVVVIVFISVLFLFQDPTQDTTLSLVILRLPSLWSVTVSQFFLVVHDLDSLVKY